MGILGTALLVWVFLDLYLRLPLPGVAPLLQGVFELLGASASWLVEEPRRVRGAGAALALLLATSLWPGRGRALGGAAGGLAGAGLLVVCVVVGGLMERGAFAGLTAAAVLGAWRVREPQSPSKLGVGVSLVVAGVAAAWLLSVFEARSSSYAPLRWLAEQDARPLLGLALVGTGLLCLDRSRLRLHLDAALAAGLVAWVASFGLDDPGARHASSVAALLSPAAVRGAALLRGWRWIEPADWPGRMTPFALAGLVLVGVAYVLRVFGCPAPEHPALTRVADVGPVFRVALSPTHAVFALRDERRYGVLPRAGGGWSHADSGALPAGQDPSLPGQSHASVEELFFAEGRFVGTALGGHPDFYSTDRSPSNTVNNLVVTLPPDGATVDSAWGQEHLCWIGALAPLPGGDLLAGCEYEPALHRLSGDGLVESLEDVGVGDVAALAVGEGSAWSVSFWRGATVARYGLDPLRLEQRRTLGGAHYDLVVDEPRDQLFASAYLGSRVRVLRAGDLSDVGTVPTGLGTRALALDPERGLLLASSVYDGVVTIADVGTLDVIDRLRVGGHVKDIAVDSAAGEAWLASRCGVHRIDLNGVGY